MPSAHHADVSTGFRKLTPGALAADRLAEDFEGLPDDVTGHGQLLAAFKAAAPRLGLSCRVVHAVDWLFKFTRADDWGGFSPPIVWPSARLQQEELGLSRSQTKALNAMLIESGLITMQDSPTGKRYGHRDKNGVIMEAYGFNLAPLAVRHHEFRRIAAEAAAERVEMARLRRRATIARKAIAQILEAAAAWGLTGDAWVSLGSETRRLTREARAAANPAQMAFVVEGLERRQTEARNRLQILTKSTVTGTSESTYTGPSQPEYRPLIQNYKTTDESYNSTVGDGGASAQQDGSERGAAGTDSGPAPAPEAGRTDSGPVMRLTIGELLTHAPRLGQWTTSASPDWPEIVNAADWVRQDLGVSRSLWGEACCVMGREAAAIAIGLVSAKPTSDFRTSPGGYFHGMVAKARDNKLHLSKTIWGLRRARAGHNSRQGMNH